MKRISFLLAVALALVAFGAMSLSEPMAFSSSPRIQIRDSKSSNWSGYAALTSLSRPQNGSVSDVKGSWVVPAVDCSITANAYSSFWVGIDGYSSNTVEQIGTDSDCSSGLPQYYAWYEMYPKYPVNLTLDVSPGDIVNAEVQFIGNGQFQLTISDANTGKSFSTTQTSKSAKRSSAEWIAEAPSSIFGVLPLASFGTVSFFNSQATIKGITGSINNSAWKNDAITMVNSSGATKALPSALSSDGTAFNITWLGS